MTVAELRAALEGLADTMEVKITDWAFDSKAELDKMWSRDYIPIRRIAVEIDPNHGSKLLIEWLEDIDRCGMDDVERRINHKTTNPLYENNDE